MELNNVVTEKDCEIVFENFLKSKNFTITQVKVDSLADTVSGMMAEYYKLTIIASVDGKDVSQSFFCKKLVMFHKIQEVMNKAQGAYDKEEYFYKFLMGECSKIPNFQVDFPPAYYFSIKDELFVLENLIETGYCLPKKENDLRHCQIGLEAIAEFHAFSIIYEEVQSKARRYNYSLHEENPDVFKDSLYRLDENYLGRHWFRNCLNAFDKLVDIAQTPVPKNEIKEKLHKYAKQLYEIISPSKKYKNVCCHGDLSNVNVLFKYENNIPIGCKIVDYQALRYNPPAHDVVNFIYLTMSTKYRSYYLNELLEHYYECLRKQLLRCGLLLEKFISKTEFDETCKYVLPQVVLQTAFYTTMRPVIAYFPEIKRDQELYKRFVYEDRSPECLKVYEMSCTFREDINDLILELYNL